MSSVTCDVEACTRYTMHRLAARRCQRLAPRALQLHTDAMVTSVSGLQYRDILVQSDDVEAAREGDMVSVHYTGRLANGDVFDTSLSPSSTGQRRGVDGMLLKDGEQLNANMKGWDRGIPLQFTLGAGEVIAGWDEGILGMRLGGKRELIVPSHLAYGDAGAGDTSKAGRAQTPIPPGAELHFEVELVNVEESSGKPSWWPF